MRKPPCDCYKMDRKEINRSIKKFHKDNPMYLGRFREVPHKDVTKSKKVPVTYVPDPSGRLWWCNSHSRKATYIQVKADGDRHCCKPGLAGILLPCNCVDLTDQLELIEEI